MIFCNCGSFKIEYRDTENKIYLCATCNKARLKSIATKVKTKKPYKIRQVSTKKAAAIVRKNNAYNEKAKEGIIWCETCGKSGVRLSHSHIVPVGPFPQFEDNVENILMECQDCHYLWEHNKPQASLIQKTFSHKLKIAKKLCPEFYNKVLNQLSK